MTLRRALFAIVVLLVAGAYVAGYWPERRRLVEARDQIATLERRVNHAEAQNRLAAILGQLLQLMDAVEARNFGDAARQATTYFDGAATESLAVTEAAPKAALDQVLGARDRVVASLALSDATAVLEELRRHEQALRRGLGFPVP
jgi:histidinol dehydrogenase